MTLKLVNTFTYYCTVTPMTVWWLERFPAQFASWKAAHVQTIKKFVKHFDEVCCCLSILPPVRARAFDTDSLSIWRVERYKLDLLHTYTWIDIPVPQDLLSSWRRRWGGYAQTWAWVQAIALELPCLLHCHGGKDWEDAARISPSHCTAQKTVIH